jgi:hypothetical protein
MPATEFASLLGLEGPYPGLRPFESHEASLFHGRQAHTDELLRRLATNRFLAVVGTSGGGKSSLVRAGLLPALYRGYLVGATSRWRIAVMRPGDAPMDRLAKELAAQQVVGDVASIGETLRRSSLGLVETVRRMEGGEGENLLLVVDQFEELFRFQRERRHQDGGAEAALFVASLLEAAESFHGRAYIVLTMRSDFLGDCAGFPGLPEALNRSQYLVPRLSREQRREAIENPVRIFGARITPRLVQRLLNDAGDEPDQLPVLQHALMRTHRKWRQDGGCGDIDFEHYEAIGGIGRALNNHPEEICRNLPGTAQPCVERVFRCLSAMEGGRVVRRPVRLERLYDVVGAPNDKAKEDVNRVIREFSAPEHSLLVSTTGPDLRLDSIIDVSHESFIRNWRMLQLWLRREAESADWFRSLREDTVRRRAGQASLWRDPELSRALEYRRSGVWTRAWAEQHLAGGDTTFDEVAAFLDESNRQQLADRRREAIRRWSLVAALTLVLLAGAAAMAFYFRAHESEKDAADARLAASKAVTDAYNQGEFLRRQLEEARATMSQTGKSQAERDQLNKKLKELERQFNESRDREAKARDALMQQNVSQSAKESEYGAALKQIASLQAQLHALRDERDDLQQQVDTYATVQVKDAGYWRSRFEEAEAKLSAASAGEPVVLALAQYSAMLVRARPFAGQLALFVDDIRRMANSKAWLFVMHGSHQIKEGFDDEPGPSKDLLRRLSQRVKCPGQNIDDYGGIWCFEVNKQRTNAYTERVGQFRAGAIVYQITTTGWTQNARPGGSDVLTLVISPVRAAALKAGK